MPSNNQIVLDPVDEDAKYYQCIIAGPVYKAGETMIDPATGKEECITAAELRAMLPDIKRGAVLWNHDPQIGHAGVIRDAHIDAQDVLHVEIALHPPVTWSPASTLREEIRTGQIRCMSIGWDKRYATDHKRFIEISVCKRGRFPRAQITRIRASQDAVAPPTVAPGSGSGGDDASGDFAGGPLYDFSVVRNEAQTHIVTSSAEPAGHFAQYMRNVDAYRVDRIRAGIRPSVHSGGQSTLTRTRGLMDTATAQIVPMASDPTDYANTVVALRGSLDAARKEAEDWNKERAAWEKDRARLAALEAEEERRNQAILVERETDANGPVFQSHIEKYVKAQLDASFRCTAPPAAGSPEAVAAANRIKDNMQIFTKGYLEVVGSRPDMRPYHDFVKSALVEAETLKAEVNKLNSVLTGVRIEQNVDQRMRAMGVAPTQVSGKRSGAGAEDEPAAKRQPTPAAAPTKENAYYREGAFFEGLFNFMSTSGHPGGNAPIPDQVKKMHWGGHVGLAPL